MSKKGLLGPEGFALWTRAAIVLKGESWERAPGVLRGERSPLDFFAAGLVGGLVGSSIRAAMTAASNGVLLSAESLSDVGLAGASLAASLAPSLAASFVDPADPAGSALDIFVKGCKFGVFFWELGPWGLPRGALTAVCASRRFWRYKAT